MKLVALNIITASLQHYQMNVNNVMQIEQIVFIKLAALLAMKILLLGSKFYLISDL